MSERVQTDAPPSCPTFDALPPRDQKMVLDAFRLAAALAERAGLPEAEVFQLLEDVVDGRAADHALAEMEETAQKARSWAEFDKELDTET